MSTEFQKESVTPELCKELGPLLQSHYKEIAHYQDIELNPNFSKYKKIDDLGGLRIYTARKEKKLIGYVIFFFDYNIHYQKSLQAIQDVLFIHPEYRGVGAQLIKWADEQLKIEGAQVVYHHVKKEHNFGPLLERFGYKCVDLIYAKRLD